MPGGAGERRSLVHLPVGSGHGAVSFEADGAAMTLSGSCRSLAGALVLATFVALAMTGCDDVPCSGEEAFIVNESGSCAAMPQQFTLSRSGCSIHLQNPTGDTGLPARGEMGSHPDRCVRVDSSCTATCRHFASATHSVSTIDCSCRASTATMRRCVRRSSPSQHSGTRDGSDARVAILKSPTDSPMRSSW